MALLGHVYDFQVDLNAIKLHIKLLHLSEVCVCVCVLARVTAENHSLVKPQMFHLCYNDSNILWPTSQLTQCLFV